MSRQSARSSDSKRVTTELFTLTYGSLVANIVKDFDTDAEINEQLDKIGFNMGLRLVEDYLARGNPGRCNDFRETANAVVKVTVYVYLHGFKIFLGITPTVTKISAAGDEFSLILENNPLTEFVDLPPEHPKLFYSNVLAGAIRGALHNVQLEVDAKFVQDQLRGDQVNEIRVKFLGRNKDVVAGDD
ncbi:Trafficking protein particle complex subunit [Fasciola gigantica]|uniref:Trafficking protein particle complex subunit n=1 Tax=Fasciola gigantica TaxID=46835 RepID=A0A504Y8L2_FASGI|nr:Trafficking protein particle complex subunit [Fasciola gigantica]